MTTPTNLQRAAWAEFALYTYNDDKAAVPLRPKELCDHKQDVLTDLLCDLMHYAHIDEALEFQEALERANMHHEAERARRLPDPDLLPRVL